MNFDVKFKRGDTQKWWGAGRVDKNQYGNYRIGMKKTPELMAYINAVPDGGYINFSLFEPKDAPKAAPAEVPFDDEIPPF